MSKVRKEIKIAEVGHLSIWFEVGRSWPIRLEMRRKGTAVYDKYALSCIQKIVDTLTQAIKECKEYKPE